MALGVGGTIFSAWPKTQQTKQERIKEKTTFIGQLFLILEVKKILLILLFRNFN
jgi:hypothetical protein